MSENSGIRNYGKGRSPKQSVIQGVAKKMGAPDPYKKKNFSRGGSPGGYTPRGSSLGDKTSVKDGEAMYRQSMDHRTDREKDRDAERAYNYQQAQRDAKNARLFPSKEEQMRQAQERSNNLAKQRDQYWKYINDPNSPGYKDPGPKLKLVNGKVVRR